MIRRHSNDAYNLINSNPNQFIGDMIFTYNIVNCEFSPWSEWSECIEHCRFENRISTRQIVQEAQNGGNNCSGAFEKAESCDSKELCKGN